MARDPSATAGQARGPSAAARGPSAAARQARRPSAVAMVIVLWGEGKGGIQIFKLEKKILIGLYPNKFSYVYI